MTHTYDVIGIGFGPANIALAIALEEFHFPGSYLFLERHASPCWQPEMLLPGSDIQNHPCRDLVTPRNPRSRYTFMNFLVENNRLYEHLNLGLEFPLRYEYAQYVSWVADFFAEHVRYSCTVAGLRVDPANENLFLVETVNGEVLRARSVVVAPGRTPLIPTQFQQCERRKVFHLTEFMSRMGDLEQNGKPKHIGVIGGSQSAAELVAYLRDRYPDARISNVMRGYGYRLKDTSQFSDHVYFPEFIDYYYNASSEAKRRINRHLHYTNYSAVDGDVISRLYSRMYEDKLREEQRIHIHGSHEIVECTDQYAHLNMTIREVNTGKVSVLSDLDAVILATGFRNLGPGTDEERCPRILDELYSRLELNEDGVLQIQRDYRLRSRAGHTLPLVYLNGLCESSHGYGDAGSFSLLALRAEEIYRSLFTQIDSCKALSVSSKQDAELVD